MPVIGWTDIAVELVGAARVGNLQSADSRRPGAAVWVSQGADGAVSAVLRLGEEAQGGNFMRVEGEYTALFLKQVSVAAIRGDWTSGVTSGEVGGYFCAARVGS